MKLIRVITIVCIALCTALNASAQRVAVASNALEWLTLSPNATVEIALTHKATLAADFSFRINKIITDKFYNNTFALSYEYRRWFKQALYGHFVGANFHYTNFSSGFFGHHYAGDMPAIGITYGYAFVLNSRWNVTPCIGIGGGLYKEVGSQHRKIVPTLTDWGIKFQYIIK